MKRVMFYVLVSCVLLAGSSCELVSEPESLFDEHLHSDTGNSSADDEIDPQPE